MKKVENNKFLALTKEAALAAGSLLKKYQKSVKKISSETQYDIKLELDVRCQKLIEKHLSKAYPEIAFLGEEGITGDTNSGYRWVVDPIDGTVNFNYGIPHACVSIALQGPMGPKDDNFSNTLVGVVYDPFTDELWTATKGGPAMLNGTIIHVSKRTKLSEAIVYVGFAKHLFTMKKMLPVFTELTQNARKIRQMGAAALAMTYVASGRFDLYAEYGVRLWDLAAAGLIIESAGGRFLRKTLKGEHTYQVIADNGHMREQVKNLPEAK
jgi:myo-inositol-1(or 4)-monophosphatase